MATRTAKQTSTKAAELNADLQAAAALVLEREQNRLQRLEKRRQKQTRRREKEQLAALHRMQTSIEVMKWCIVGIASIMFLGLVIAIWILSAVRSDVERVQVEIEKVQPKIERVVNEITEVVDEVGRVRESLKNPLQSIGNAFGKELDAKLQNFVESKLEAGGK